VLGVSVPPLVAHDVGQMSLTVWPRTVGGLGLGAVPQSLPETAPEPYSISAGSSEPGFAPSVAILLPRPAPGVFRFRT
jgi:hypothetical protein